MIPLRIFIGYDQRETVAYHVLAHSLQRYATVPISIAPLDLKLLKRIGFERERDPKQSTDFAFSRFLVPYLCDYDGLAIFMDCDMLCREDIGTLLSYHPAIFDCAVAVVKHDYTPRDGWKFLGHQQHPYPKKNWSSFLLFDCNRCKALDIDVVNNASGLFLHQFKWCRESEVFGLSSDWNHLVGEYPENPKAKMVHFTQGGPWFEKYRYCEFADAWHLERARMMGLYAEGEPLGIGEK